MSRPLQDSRTSDATPASTNGELIAVVYEELRKLAASRLTNEPAGQTLQATALVHEAWLRLGGAEGARFENHGHFFGAAAEAMRRILIDRARRKRALRHGGQKERVDIADVDIASPCPDDELLAVNDVLDEFARQEPLKAELVKLHVFAGLTFEEITQVLGLSLSTTKRHWMYARAWLYEEIQRRQPLRQR